MRVVFTARRFRFVGHAAVAAALFLIAGGHWGAWQMVAWAGMLWNYTQEDGSLLSGVRKTFDGENPCAMCESIKTAKENEQAKPVTLVSSKKIEAFPAPLRAALPQRECRELAFEIPADVTAEVRSEAPPAPVPIGAAIS